MTEITITQIVQAIADTIDTEPTVKQVQSGLTLSESIQNQPVVQVYWEDENIDAASQNDRTTFKAGVRQSELTINADVYVRQRAHIGEDMAAVMTLAEAVRNTLAAQKIAPFFNLEGIKSYHWRAERVTFEYADVKYAGIRFIITIRVY